MTVVLIIYYQDHFLLKSLSVWSVFLFFFSSFLLVLVENKLPVHFNWTNNLFELFPRYLKYHTYSCISRPPFLSTKIRFFIISGQRGSIQTDRSFPKVNLLFLGMRWKHGELKNCRAQCNRVEVYQHLFKLPRLKRTSLRFIGEVLCHIL